MHPLRNICIAYGSRSNYADWKYPFTVSTRSLQRGDTFNSRPLNIVAGMDGIAFITIIPCINKVRYLDDLLIVNITLIIISRGNFYC